jgi:hypothetical protein
MSVLRPGKVIEVVVTATTGTDAWPYDDGSNDPWYVNRNPYRWRVEMSVPGENHSSHKTREPFVWNGLDVNVGDWIGGKNEPIAVKIIKIESKTVATVTCIVEDIDRFNTFNDPTGNGIGIFGTGDAVIFELGDDGMPILNPLPFGVPANFVADVESKFRIQNPVYRYRLQQKAHTLQVGDQAAITPSGYVKASLSNDKVVGYVTDVGPGPDIFFIRPSTKIVERHLPALPGNVADYIYINDTMAGKLDNTPGGDPVFIKLSNEIPAYIKGTALNPALTPGNILTINGIPVTLTGATLASAITDINLATVGTGVTAYLGLVSTTVVGTVSGPFTGNTPPVTASLNGTTITISSQSQYPGWSVLGDIIYDINLLSDTHGVVASDDNGYLRLTNDSGGNITIFDIDPPAPTAGNRKSFIEATGLTSVPANTDQVIILKTSDGRQILLQNNTGDPLSELGLVSVDNGQLPIGLVVETGVRKADMYVVPNIPARNALVPKIGDQAYVVDTGQGEWGLYVWNNAWGMIANHDSARTDAETISIDILWSNPTTNAIYRVSDGSRVSMITVDVLEAFNSISPSLTIGDVLDTSRLMGNNMIDLTVAESFVATPSHQYSTGGTETEINAYFNSNGATQGHAKVTITYV